MRGELPPKSRSRRHLLDQAIQSDAQIAILQRLSANNPPAIRFPHGWDAIQDDAARGNTRQRDAPTLKLACVQHLYALRRLREWDTGRALALENSQCELGCVFSQRREADEIASNSSTIQNVFGVNVRRSVGCARNQSKRVVGQERPPCTILREARKQDHGPRREITHPLQQIIYR